RPLPQRCVMDSDDSSESVARDSVADSSAKAREGAKVDTDDNSTKARESWSYDSHLRCRQKWSERPPKTIARLQSMSSNSSNTTSTTISGFVGRFREVWISSTAANT